jgi:hypothetical protein
VLLRPNKKAAELLPRGCFAIRLGSNYTAAGAGSTGQRFRSGRYATESFLDFRGHAGQNLASVGQYVVSPSPRPSEFWPT